MPPKPQSSRSTTSRTTPGSQSGSSNTSRDRPQQKKSQAKKSTTQTRHQDLTSAAKEFLANELDKLLRLRIEAFKADVAGKSAAYNEHLESTHYSSEDIDLNRPAQENAIDMKAQRLEFETEVIQDKIRQINKGDDPDASVERLRELWDILERIYLIIDDFDPRKLIEILDSILSEKGMLLDKFDDHIKFLRTKNQNLRQHAKNDLITGTQVRGIIAYLLNLLPNYFGVDDLTVMELKKRALRVTSISEAAVTPKVTSNSTVPVEWERYKSLPTKAPAAKAPAAKAQPAKAQPNNAPVANKAKEPSPLPQTSRTTNNVTKDTSTTNDDGEWGSDDDGEITFPGHFGDIVNHFYGMATDTIEFLDDSYTIPPEEPFSKALRRIFAAAYDIKFTNIRDVRRHMTTTVKAVLQKVDHVVGSSVFDLNDVGNLVEELYDTVDQLYTEAVFAAINQATPMAYFDYRGTCAYVVLKRMLTDFQKEKPRSIKSPWGDVHTHGSGIMRIYDDHSRGIQMQAEYVPHNLKVKRPRVLLRQYPAWIPKRYLEKSGYEMTVEFPEYMRFRNKAGASIWMLHPMGFKAYVPMVQLTKVVKMIKIYCRLQDVSYSDFCSRGGFTDSDYSDDDSDSE